MRTVGILTLGCKVNTYESEYIISKLKEKEYEIKDFNDICDVYIINTCTVTNVADRKSRQMLRRVKEINPEAVLVATGCYVQVGKEELEKIKREILRCIPFHGQTPVK